MSTNQCPFSASSMIKDSRFFVGREYALQVLLDNMTGVQPTSVDVYGERRVGKSSLLYHFFSEWSSKVGNPTGYGVAYVDLQGEDCSTASRFFAVVTKELQRAMNLPLRHSVHDFASFRETLQDWRQQGRLPVLCLDKFERIGNHPQVFDDDFFDTLRFLLNSGLLMVILSSRLPVAQLRDQLHLTSAFFNLGHHLPLGEFSPEEAEKLLMRPGLDSQDKRPCLSLEEQKLALRWGGYFPYTLQLAAYCLYHNRGDIARAERRFNEEIKNNSSLGRWWGWTHLPVLGRFSDFLATSGDVIFRTGQLRSRVVNTLMGAIFWLAAVCVVGLIILLLADKISWGQFIEFFKPFFGK